MDDKSGWLLEVSCTVLDRGAVGVDVTLSVVINVD